MDVVRFADPAAFAARTTTFLLAEEARHNVLLWVPATLIERPEVYPEFHLWTVEDGGAVVLAGVLTPPFNVTLSRPAAGGAVEALAGAIHAEAVLPPGVSGAVPEVDAFVAAWAAITGEVAALYTAQRLFRLTEVRPVRGVPGAMREATLADRDLLLAWEIAFAAEVLGQREHERTERMLDLRLRAPDPGLYLWENQAGTPVSLVATGGRTPNGIMIGPVYTPPDSRGRGYASALTAGVSALLLERGCTFCLLYTDLSNPTSNHIYQEVGYEAVCDAAGYRFEPR